MTSLALGLAAWRPRRVPGAQQKGRLVVAEDIGPDVKEAIGIGLWGVLVGRYLDWGLARSLWIGLSASFLTVSPSKRFHGGLLGGLLRGNRRFLGVSPSEEGGFGDPGTPWDGGCSL